jgi:glycosyltransferase involved in cell wall biosynthesis
MGKGGVRSQGEPVEHMEIDVSVVVPFFNAEKHIEDCAQALLAQTYPPTRYEIVMVDNNSTDRSAQLVRKYPRIQLLAEQKQGSYAARNRGVAAARGPIIAFTDADCVPSPDWLQKIMAALCAPGVELIQGGRVYGGESSALSILAAYEAERAAYTFSGESSGIYYGYTNNMAVRRSLLDRCGPFLEIMRGADSLFVNRVIADYSCGIIRYVPQARIRHLEITSTWSYLRKRIIHGRSLQQNYSRRKSTHRPLGIAERFMIITRTVERKKYSRLQRLHLILLVLLGMGCFSAGRLSIKLRDAVLGQKV